MAKIQVTPEQLKVQGANLNSLAEEMNSLNAALTSAIALLEGALSGKFSNNMKLKAALLRKQGDTVAKALVSGGAAAIKAAESYTTVDQELANQGAPSNGHGGAGRTHTGDNEGGAPENPSGTSGMQGVNLKPNMGAYSLNQYSYTAFKKPYGYNAGCCATAYATGLSIVNGKAYDPTSFWKDGTTWYSAGHLSTDYNWGTDSYQKIAENLANGKPTMMHFKHNLYQDGEHWVLITGIKEGADKNNLQMADFTVTDPADGQTKSWQQVYDHYKGYSNIGYNLFV